METVIKTEKGYACPHCKETLGLGSLKFSDTGELTFEVGLTSDGYLEYEQDEFFSDGSGGEFYCGHCGRGLFGGWDEELAKKILKSEVEV